MAFTLWAIVQSAMWCFSRDDKKPGYVTKILEVYLSNQRKQGEFLDALSEREMKQQELCARHNENIELVAQKVVEHHEGSERNWAEVGRLKAIAREACQIARKVATKQWPQSVEDVSRHCDRIEQIIDNT